MITSLRIRALTSPEVSATAAPTMATIIRPTAAKPMKFGINEVYMKRMPSAVSRLRTSIRAGGSTGFFPPGV